MRCLHIYSTKFKSALKQTRIIYVSVKTTHDDKMGQQEMHSWCDLYFYEHSFVQVKSSAHCLCTCLCVCIHVCLTDICGCVRLTHGIAVHEEDSKRLPCIIFQTEEEWIMSIEVMCCLGRSQSKGRFRKSGVRHRWKIQYTC